MREARKVWRSTFLQELAARIVGGGLGEQHLGVARDAGERRVDLVRDAGGEDAERGQAVLLA